MIIPSLTQTAQNKTSFMKSRKPSRDCRNSEPADVELVTRLCGCTSNKANVSIQVQTRGETKYIAPKSELRQRSKLPNSPPGVNCSHPSQIQVSACQARYESISSPPISSASNQGPGQALCRRLAFYLSKK